MSTEAATAAEPRDRPLPHSGVDAIQPYVPGKSSGTGKTLFKLSSNETPLGPSPDARQALAAVANHLELYPDGASTALREAIADVHDLDADRILCGCGSDEILHMATQAFCNPGDEVIYTRHGFLVYRLATLVVNAVPVVADESAFTTDVDAILARVTERTKVVFVANPNNPTGTYAPMRDIQRLHAALPGHVLLVLDGAYAEYVNRNDYESGLSLARSEPNVLMTRTFSKIHGLAALRIGWCYADARIIDSLNRVRGPFNMSAPAIAAGAAAIRDSAHLAKAVDHNLEWVARVTTSLTGLGLTVTPSVANFVLIHFPDVDGKRARDADACLLSKGLVLRRLEPYSLPNALRMTIGTAEANQAVVAALGDFMRSS